MYNPVSSTMNITAITKWLHLASSNKNSIRLQWHMDAVDLALVSGYKVRYQAVGSNVVQFSPLLGSSISGYDIAMLHEDTNYDVCLQVYMNHTEERSFKQCLQASTSTDSLTVALGSTFGAFLALGIIVLFVFLAKWQHQRRLAKQQLEQVSPESFDSMVQGDGDYELSDVSLQVNEDTLKLELSSQSSSQAQSMTANGTLHLQHLPPDIEEDDEDDDCSIMVHEPPDYDSGHHSPLSPESPPRPSTSSEDQPICMDIGDGDSPTDALIHPLSQSYPRQPDDRPPDVRPKDKALLDLTHMYANKKLFEQPQSQLRPNMSCNW